MAEAQTVRELMEKDTVQALISAMYALPKDRRLESSWRLGRAAWQYVVRTRDDQCRYLSHPSMNSDPPTLLGLPVRIVDGNRDRILLVVPDRFGKMETVGEVIWR